LSVQPLGCDNVLNSDAREDICGVCNGNDSTATTITDSAAGFNEEGELLSSAVSQ